MNVKIKLVNGGKVPHFAHEDDACCDCYANEDMTINVGCRVLVGLGFALELPKGYEAVIRPRSGLSSKGVDIAIGTVDCGYNGEVKANVINNGTHSFEIKKGDRICQMAIRPIPSIQFEEIAELSETERSSNGFGSTGV